MIALMVITDGRRDCIIQTVASARTNLHGPITYRVIYDDSGDEQHRRWLAETFPDFDVIHHPLGRQGFGGAIRTAWTHLAGRPEPYVFHLEDDFTFNRPVDLTPMTATLEVVPHLVQLALRRQPWNDAERAAGGIIEQHPGDYTDEWSIVAMDRPEHPIEAGTVFMHRVDWLEHRRFFTTNPSLYRRALIAEGWPDVDHSEGHFTHQLLRDHPDWRFGFWGARDSGEWVTHIGHERVGIGY